MTNDDQGWIRTLLGQHVIQGKVLELGAGYGGETSRNLVQAAGLTYFGTDLEITDSNVDFAANFEVVDDLRVFDGVGPFDSVLILNVLEHTFDPIRILDHSISLLRPGGVCVVLTPTLWPIHNFPFDAWRILPNFYEEYARRRGLKLLEDRFEYIGWGRVSGYLSGDGTMSYPPAGRSKFHLLWSKVIHKLFNTVGRGMFQPSHLAIGAVFVRN